MDTRPNFVCRYASQVVCLDTRPKLCVWIRVPNCVYGYASQLRARIRVPNELFIKVRNECPRACTHMYTCIRVPTSCMYTRPKLCVWIRVPSCVYGYASQLCVWIRVPT